MLIRRLSFLLLACLLTAMPMSRSFAQSPATAGEETNDEEASAADEEPEALQLDAVLEATDSTPYAVRPDEWSEYIVREAVPHGAQVRAGQVLIRFESDKLDDKIETLARQRRIDELALRQATQDLELLRKTMPIELEQAVRSERIAAENLAIFRKVDRARKIKALAFSVEQTQNYLSYEREELDQLEKMYKADDLTEETEEIILTRARNSVQSAEFGLRRAVDDQQRQLEITLPREAQTLEQGARDAALQLEKLKITQPIKLNQETLALEKKKADFLQQAQTLDELQADRKWLTITATRPGYLYYGGSQSGQWPEIAQMRKSLQPGKTVPIDQTLLTVVAMRPMFARCTFAEEHLHQVRSGTKVNVKPTGYPEMELNGRVAQVSPIPVADGKFDAIVEVKFAGGEKSLAPGMGVKIELPAKKGSKE